MIGQTNSRRAVFVLLFVTSAALEARAIVLPAVNTEVPGLVYHAQVTSYYCATATVEMMLDNTAVRNNNPYLNWILNPANAPDPIAGSFFNPITHQDSTFGTIPFNAVNNIGQSIHPTIAPRVIPGVNGGNPVNAVTYGPQLALYDFTHNAGTFTPVAGPNAGTPLFYNNPFIPWGSGGGINGQQVELNVYDNPNVGGEGIHAFTAYNVASFNQANRTIADAIIDYQVPAGGVFYSGAHAMAITGVRTDVAPVRNQPYQILGFYVDDPWYGYAKNRGLPANQRGLDPHTFVSNVPQRVPVGRAVTFRPSKWSQIFNRSPGERGEGAYAQGLGYKFVVEPQGPEPLDDGFNGSDPGLADLLATPLTAAQALSTATSLLQQDSELSAKYGLSNGAFDGNNMTMLDPGGDDDWLIPYQQGGSYTGAFLLSADTGVLDEATWIDSGESNFVLPDLLAEYQGLESGFHPSDNPAPEPSTVALLAIGAMLCARRRARGI